MRRSALHSLWIVVLLLPAAAAQGFEITAHDHPGSLRAYDDFYNERTSFPGEFVTFSFDYRITRDARLSVMIPATIRQGVEETAEGFRPGQQARDLPNLLYHTDRSGWTIESLDKERHGLVADITPDRLNGSSGPVDVKQGITYRIVANVAVPTKLGLLPLVAWDVDKDGAYNDQVGGLVLRNVVAGQGGDIALEVEPEVLLLTQFRFKDDLRFTVTDARTGAELSSSQPEFPAALRIEVKDKDVTRTWFNKAPKPKMMEVKDRVTYEANTDMLVKVRLDGQLAKHGVQILIDGEPLRKKDGTPWVWTPDSHEEWVVLPAGTHSIQVNVLDAGAGRIEGEVLFERAGVAYARIPVVVERQTQDLTWTMYVAAAVVAAIVAPFAYRPHRFITGPKGGYCTRRGRIVARPVRTQGGEAMARFADFPIEADPEARRAAKLTRLEARYPAPLVALVPRRPDGSIGAVPSGLMGKKIQGEAVGCRACPARTGCWDPSKRGVA